MYYKIKPPDGKQMCLLQNQGSPQWSYVGNQTAILAGHSPNILKWLEIDQTISLYFSVGGLGMFG